MGVKPRSTEKPEQYVDWYDANTQAEAKALGDADLDLVKNGLAGHDISVEIVECDSATLKPIPTL
jgi:hypothetical protein